MRRAACLLAVLAATASAAGCAGGIPTPARVKLAARDWAQQRLGPRELAVTLVIVTRDQRRARVRLKADGRRYDVRLGRRGGGWTVTSAKRA